MLDSSTTWMARWHTPSFLRSHFKIHCISLCMYVYFIFQPSSTHETYRFKYNMRDLRDSLLQSHLHQDSHQDFLLCSLRVEMSRTQIDWFCIASQFPDALLHRRWLTTWSHSQWLLCTTEPAQCTTNHAIKTIWTFPNYLLQQSIAISSNLQSTAIHAPSTPFPFSH